MVLREMLVDDLDQVMKIDVPGGGRKGRNPGLLWTDHGSGRGRYYQCGCTP